MFGLKLIRDTMLLEEGDENPYGGGGSTTSDIPPEVYQRYVNGTATEDDLVLLVQADEITPAQAQSYEPKGGDDSLTGDLANMGLLPISTGSGGEPYIDDQYYITRPDVLPNATRFADQYGNILNQKGTPVTEAERKRMLGSGGIGGSGGSSDPYAGEANARANAAAARDATRLQEQIRAQRLEEAMSAIDDQRQRRQAYLAAQMEGAGFSLPAGTTHFPGLGPDSPAVRSGLADPFRVNPVAYNPSMVLEQGNWQADLARLRAGSGG